MELDSEKNNPTISELVSSMKNVLHLQAIYYYFILRYPILSNTIPNYDNISKKFLSISGS